MKLRILILAPLMLLTACANRTVVTGLPPNVTQAQVNGWQTATNTLKTLSDATHTIQVSVITANRNGFFKDGDGYAATVAALGRADALELRAAQFLQTVPNSFGQSIQKQLMEFALQINVQLNIASQQLGIPASIVTSISSAINLGLQIEQLIQSLTSGKLEPAFDFALAKGEIQ